jgi:hypothetical protein
MYVRQPRPELIFSSCIIMAVAGLCGSARADEKTAAQAEKLLSETVQLTDIRAPGSTPFRLNARLVGTEDKDHPFEATYSLEWQSPTSWRDEISAPNYKEVRVAWNDHLFISRNPSNPDSQAFQLRRLIELPVRFDLNPIMRIEKLSEKRTQGALQRIVEVSMYQRLSMKLYINDSLPTISRIESKGAGSPTYPFYDFDSSLEYEDYKEFHGHRFPYKLIQRNSGRATGEVEIVELTEAPSQTTSFDPPPDAHWIRWCAHPIPARAIPNQNQLLPGPPPQIRHGAPPLHVQIYGIIGTDGAWHNLTVLKSEGEVVDSWVLRLMVRTKYSPATCDGTPVESEEIREFNYRSW